MSEFDMCLIDILWISGLNNLLLLKILVLCTSSVVVALYVCYTAQYWKVTAARTTELYQVCFWLQIEKVSTTVSDNVYAHTPTHSVAGMSRHVYRNGSHFMSPLQVKHVMLTQHTFKNRDQLLQWEAAWKLWT